MTQKCRYCLLFERCPCGCAWGICSDVEQFTEEGDGDGCESFEPNDEWFEELDFLADEAADQRREMMEDDRWM